jgi:hypothetical protein
MEKEFVPYEQSLALKELGFDEPCFGCYTEKKEVIIRVGDYRSFLNNNSEDTIVRDFNSYENGTISLPLYQQAFRWFREKYNLVSHQKKDFTDGVFYGYESIIECIDGIIDVGTFKTYEEAELECLKKLIEIVKK